jgi:hypothetical protein
MTVPRPAPPGWYLDPALARVRWWDGETWRDHPPAGTAPAPAAVPWGRDLPAEGTPPAPMERPWWPARHIAHGAHAKPEPSPLVAAALDRPWQASILAAVVLAVVVTVSVPALRTPGGSTPGASTGPTAAPPTATAGPSRSGTPATPTPTKPSSNPSRSLTSSPGGSTSASSPATGSATLASADGSGDGSVPPFTTTGEWRLSYRFDCGAIGGPSAFVIADGSATLVRTNAYTGADDLLLRAAGPHTLRVETACDWSVTVVGTSG